MKYTKGEWKASHPLFDKTTFITTGFLLGIMSWGTMVREGKQRANAHLIAAAPDMYEALKAILAEYNKLTEIQGGDMARAIGGLGVKALMKAEKK